MLEHCCIHSVPDVLFIGYVLAYHAVVHCAPAFLLGAFRSAVSVGGRGLKGYGRADRKLHFSHFLTVICRGNMGAGNFDFAAEFCKNIVDDFQPHILHFWKKLSASKKIFRYAKF